MNELRPRLENYVSGLLQDHPWSSRRFLAQVIYSSLACGRVAFARRAVVPTGISLGRLTDAVDEDESVVDGRRARDAAHLEARLRSEEIDDRIVWERHLAAASPLLASLGPPDVVCARLHARLPTPWGRIPEVGAFHGGDGPAPGLLGLDVAAHFVDGGSITLLRWLAALGTPDVLLGRRLPSGMEAMRQLVSAVAPRIRGCPWWYFTDGIGARVRRTCDELAVRWVAPLQLTRRHIVRVGGRDADLRDLVARLCEEGARAHGTAECAVVLRTETGAWEPRPRTLCVEVDGRSGGVRGYLASEGLLVPGAGKPLLRHLRRAAAERPEPQSWVGTLRPRSWAAHQRAALMAVLVEGVYTILGWEHGIPDGARNDALRGCVAHAAQELLQPLLIPCRPRVRHGAAKTPSVGTPGTNLLIACAHRLPAGADGM